MQLCYLWQIWKFLLAIDIKIIILKYFVKLSDIDKSNNCLLKTSIKQMIILEECDKTNPLY